LIEFVTVLANRTNGRKGADRIRKVLTPEALDFVRREVGAGRGLRDTVLKANQLGLKTERGERISLRAVSRYMNTIVQKLVPLEDVKHSFAEFVSEHIKAKKGSKIQAAAIHSAYQLWCRTKKVVPISARKCGDWMRANRMVASSRAGYCWYSDVEILGYPNVLDATGKWATQYDNGVRGETMSYLGRKRGKRLHKPKS
jgi:hypothetical protein